MGLEPLVYTVCEILFHGLWRSCCQLGRILTTRHRLLKSRVVLSYRKAIAVFPIRPRRDYRIPPLRIDLLSLLCADAQHRIEGLEALLLPRRQRRKAQIRVVDICGVVRRRSGARRTTYLEDFRGISQTRRSGAGFLRRGNAGSASDLAPALGR
jgi:hypothetical protein